MISHVSSIPVPVTNQNRALAFYRDTMGFDVLADTPMGPDARWIAVAPKGADTHLVLYTPPGMENRIGTFTGYVFSCEDAQATFEELKGRGVEFTQEPSEQPWGIWAQFKDVDGNEFGLIQR